MGKVMPISTDQSIELVPLPAELAVALRHFLLDKRRGNISLNIRDGMILGFHVEQIVTISNP